MVHVSDFHQIEKTPNGMMRLYARILLSVGGTVFVIHGLLVALFGFQDISAVQLGLDGLLLVLAFLMHESSEARRLAGRSIPAAPMLLGLGLYLVILCYETGGLSSPYFPLVIATSAFAALVVRGSAAALIIAVLGATYALFAWLAPFGMIRGSWETVVESLMRGRQMGSDEFTALAVNEALFFLAAYMAHRVSTALRSQVSTLTERAERDPLTKLPNRRSFMEKLGGEFARAERYAWPISILMIDLDHFKRINDRYGHGLGDQVLSQAAQLLRDAAGPMDHLARIGGEEFAVAAVAADPNHGADLATRIITAFRNYDWSPIVPGLQVTCSAGVATLGAAHTHLGPDNAIARLFEEADTALYEAKQNGRDNFRVSAPRFTPYSQRSMS